MPTVYYCEDCHLYFAAIDWGDGRGMVVIEDDDPAHLDHEWSLPWSTE